MNKKLFLWVVLELVFLVVFNTVFFIVGGTSHPASVWISYLFIHLAYLMVVMTPFLTRKSTSASVFGISLHSISSAYFLTAFVVGVVMILLRLESYKPALLIQIVLAGIYAIILISHLIANETTADNEERREEEIAYIKEAASRVKILKDKLPSKKANREIEKLYDLLHSSPSKSSPSVQTLEMDIISKIAELEAAVSSQDEDRAKALSLDAYSLVELRNRKVKRSS